MESYSRNELNTALHNWQFDNVDICMNEQATFLLNQGGAGKALKQMSKKELYAMAKTHQIKGRSAMTKDELVVAVRKAARAMQRKQKKSVR